MMRCARSHGLRLCRYGAVLILIGGGGRSTYAVGVRDDHRRGQAHYLVRPCAARPTTSALYRRKFGYRQNIGASQM
eukprot:4006022-Pleurochrysis_carterae.AAC.2